MNAFQPSTAPEELEAPHRAPWARSWLYCAPGKGIVFAWLIGLHAVTLIGLFFVPLPSWELLLAAFLLCLPGALGLSLAFHRGLAHGAVKFHPKVESALIFLAMFNGFGAPSSWAATHQLHHRHEDTSLDVSSPTVGGFWWGHIRWLWQWQALPESDYPPRLRDTRYLRWKRWQIPIMALALFWPLVGGLTFWFWMGPARLVYALHAQMLINSATHMGEQSGEGGTSRNLTWLAFLQGFIGESWHRNHHIDPGAAKMGKDWWQVDLGWTLIRLLRRLNLAHSVREPKPTLG